MREPGPGGTMVVLALALAVVAGGVAAQPASVWPSRPVRMIVPLAAGGGMDTIARRIAVRLGESLGQSVVVDNRPGGGGNIGVEVAVRAAPDGHTLLMISASQLTFTLLYKAAYDPARDFTPLTQVTTQPFVLVVHPSVPAQDLRAFITWARAHPGRLNYASSGNGGLIHLATELLKGATGIDMVHVPYKGMAASYTDLFSAQVQVALPSIISVLPHVKSGRLRGLGVSAAARSRMLPELPTLAEAGVKGFQVAQWYGIVGPAGLPRPVSERLQREVAAVLAQPEVAARIAAEGSEPVSSSLAAFAAHIGAELARWSGVIRRTGIRGT